MKRMFIKQIFTIFSMLLVFNMIFLPTVRAEDIFGGVDSFIQAGQEQESFLNTTALDNTSTDIYNVFLSVGIVIAIVVGVVIGIKLMSEGALERAKLQEALIPYVVGVFVLFSAFAIWKMVINAGNGIFN